MQALKEKTDVTGKKVAIIGSGGAARAIGFGILSEGGKVTIFSRSAKKGECLAKDLGSDYHPLSEFKKASCQIFINATPVGMLPDTEAMPIPREVIEKETVVMDIVYNPLKTRLLKEAQDIGCITVDGVSMFVYQGAFQFELWTGEKAPIDIMTKTVLDALGAK
jgi:shikimate dehydrogenase